MTLDTGSYRQQIDSKDTYFYDTTLVGLEDETQWSETILRGLAGLLRTKTKKLNRMVQTKKKWLYKP